jgi:predicted kinase
MKTLIKKILAEEGYYGHVITKELPQDLDNRLYTLSYVIGGFTTQDVMRFVNNSTHEEKEKLHRMVTSLPSTQEDLRPLAGSYRYLLKSPQYINIIHFIKSVGKRKITAEGVEGDQEWHTGKQGDLFTLDGSENLGNTDIFKDDGFDIIHQYRENVHLSDLSPEEEETAIPQGSKKVKKLVLKPRLDKGPFNIMVTESQITKVLMTEAKVVGFDRQDNNFVVVAGGPGAGKSFVSRNLIDLPGVKEFNVDNYRVHLAKKLWGDEWETKISTPEGYQEILKQSFTTSDPRNVTVRFLKMFLQQDRKELPNVVFDAGGGQQKVMEDVWRLANDNGYETTLIYVKTSLGIAHERNEKRSRSLAPEMVTSYHQLVSDNIGNMVDKFDHVWVVNNDSPYDLASRPHETIEKVK